MKEFIKGIKFKIIIGLLVILAGFMVYSGTVEGFDVLPSKIIGFIVTPFQQVSSIISNNVGDFFGKFIKADEIEKENQALKEEINKLREDMAGFDNIKQQNDRYKDFLGLKEENPDMVFEEAKIVERDPNSQFYSFKIDKGSLHGVSYRDVVITPAGIVGVVSKVGYTYSTVQTILDPAVSVGCVDSRTGDTGIISGNLTIASNGLCKMSYIDKSSGISAGDIIITSGSERFPKNLVVGIVQSVHTEENGSALYAIITPSDDIKSIKSVFVIKEFFGKSSVN